ncbi:hypothetical protein ScPMuIL_005400 [Solemya velum]
MIDLLHDIEVAAISILKKIPFGYDSEFTASELLDSLAAVAETDLNDVETMLTDESTDLTNTKRLVLYGQLISDERLVLHGQLISDEMNSTTVYINNIECKDQTGKGIAATVTEAAADIPLLQKHQQTLTDLFYYFNGSSRRESRLHEIQAILDDPCLTIKEIHSPQRNIRVTTNQPKIGLKSVDAVNSLDLQTVRRSIPTLLATVVRFAPLILRIKILKPNRPLFDQSSGPWTVSSPTFMSSIPLARIRKQQVKLDLCVGDLEEVKTLETSYLKQLQDNLKQNNVPGFSDADLLASFSVLGMRPISFLTYKDLQEYGVEGIAKLCDFYGTSQVVQWTKSSMRRLLIRS